MIGEIGGSAEVDAINWYKAQKNRKPIAGFIAGATAPKEEQAHGPCWCDHLWRE